MKNLFENWLKENKENISRPDKYSNTIQTISNQLKLKYNIDFNLYTINNAEDALKQREVYFSFDEFYQKNKTGNNM